MTTASQHRLAQIVRRSTGMAILLSVIALFQGCAQTESARVVSEPRIFRGEWFDYYQRAMWRIQESRYAEAEADLRAAIAGNGVDSRDARTYGVHFMEYFPHRELGILALRKGDYAPAEDELELSLRQTPTAKAKYYLNEARRVRARAEGADTAAPVVRVEGAASPVHTNQLRHRVSGVATDDTCVERVLINGESILLEIGAPSVPFSRDVALADGENSVVVTAIDLLGRQTEARLTINVDVVAPALSVDEVRVEEAQGARRVWIRGGAVDRGGIESCVINDAAVEARGEAVEIKQWFDVAAEAEEIPFLVRDQSGNECSGTIPLRDQGGKRRVGHAAHQPPIRLASLGGGLAPWLTAAVEGADPPEITLDSEPVRKVFDTQFYLTGKAADSESVVAIDVTGSGTRQLDIRPGALVHFGCVLELSHEGENHFSVTARNAAGGVRTATLTLVRSLPGDVGRGKPLCVAPYAFEPSAGVPDGLDELALGHFTSALHASRRFDVFERRAMDAALLEHEIASLNGNRELALFARLGAADLLLFGSLIPDSSGIDIILTITDVDEPSESIPPLDVYYGRRDAGGLQEAMRWLCLKLSAEFPMVAGTIVKTKGRQAWVDLNASHRLRRGTRLEVLRPESGAPDAVSGQGALSRLKGTLSRLFGGTEAVAAAPAAQEAETLTPVGRLKVERIYKDQSLVSIVDVEEGEEMRAGDIVITE